MMTNTINMIKKMFSLAAAMMMITAMMAYIPNAKATEELNVEASINEMAELINNARKNNGLSEVYVLPYLNEVAEVRAIETAIDYSHIRRNGFNFDSAVDTSVVDFTFAAENISAGNATAEETFAVWQSDENSIAKIMTENATHIGVGIVYDEESEYGYYWQTTVIATEQHFADEYIPGKSAEASSADGDITGDGIVNTYDYIALAGYIT
ncbi:MAG: CAP domain-containing protein, partial [Ruminococcus sp.]|nr:CAP domain-containing protein [Ruminococcus sp.]